MAELSELELTPETIEQVSQFYKTLSDPTRIRILTLLNQSELNVSAIVEELGLEQSTVSHQLKLLRLNRLVKSRKAGKIVYYSLDDAHVVDILCQTLEHVTHSD